MATSSSRRRESFSGGGGGGGFGGSVISYFRLIPKKAYSAYRKHAAPRG